MAKGRDRIKPVSPQFKAKKLKQEGRLMTDKALGKEKEEEKTEDKVEVETVVPREAKAVLIEATAHLEAAGGLESNLPHTSPYWDLMNEYRKLVRGAN